MPGGIHPPLTVVATWPKPNFEDPVKHSHTTAALMSVLAILTTGTTLARIWARAVLQRKAGLDDWLMLVSLVPTIGITIGVAIANETLFDRHIWDCKPSEYISQRKITWALELLYVISSGIVKTSVLLFYRRMAFQTISNVFRISTVISIVSVALFTLGYLFAIFFSCRPLTAFWDQLDTSKVLGGLKYTCYDELAHLLSAGIISTIQDFIATTLPAILCWNLHISVKEKVALYTCFASGYAVAVISAARCYYISYIFSHTYDVPWYAWYVWILTALEICVGTTCANLPALKVFYKHVNGGSPLSGGYNTISRMARKMLSSRKSKASIEIGLDDGTYAMPR